jgi:hypothetical protein
MESPNRESWLRVAYERLRADLLGAVCGCGRILRVARATFEGGPILCGKCGKPFDLEESPRVNAEGDDA